MFDLGGLYHAPFFLIHGLLLLYVSPFTLGCDWIGIPMISRHLFYISCNSFCTFESAAKWNIEYRMEFRVSVLFFSGLASN